jgi:hypothetical protein
LVVLSVRKSSIRPKCVSTTDAPQGKKSLLELSTIN